MKGKKEINIGLIGFGVVGSGTAQLIKEHKKELETRIGAKLNIRWICSRHKKRSRWISSNTKQTKKWKDVIKDPKVDCVVELIGGTNPAKKIVTSALLSGKHVVTANKAILAQYWNEIVGLANKNKRLLYFEAAVGGGIPVIQALNEGMAGNRIHKILGILNGTTNYILTRMQEKGIDFKTAVKQAQEAGFAESNPSFDVNGIDAAQKISILGSLATGQWIPPSRVYCEGISQIKPIDLRLIKEEYKSTVKLLGIGEKTKGGWVFRVHPTIISGSHPFANVRNEYNAVLLHGNASDDIMLYGKGAGRLATSSAVVSDLIFLTRQIVMGTAGHLPYVSQSKAKKIRFAPMAQSRGMYYIRVNASDSKGVLSRITGVLAKHGVSIESIHQDPFYDLSIKRGVPIILVTDENLEKNVKSAVKAIDALSTTLSKTVLIRMG